MTDEIEQQSARESKSIDRRTVLSTVGASSVALVGVAAFTGTAAAWRRFEPDFRGCSEVWIVTHEDDLDKGLYAYVVVENADGEAECRQVHISSENATTIPGQHGDSPVRKFSVGDDEKILAVIETSTHGSPLCYVENDHPCTATPNTPDWRTADCVPEDLGPC